MIDQDIDAQATPYPKFLLRHIKWDFAEPVTDTLEDFLEAVRKYSEGIDQEDPTDELEAELPFQDVLLRVGDFTLRVRGSILTPAKLLMRVHKKIGYELGDHCYFEGLELVNADTPSEVPEYDVLLGS